MSSKKRKGDVPENAAAEDVHATSRNMQPKSDTDGGNQRNEPDFATTRILLMQRDAELASALLEIERLRAAASEPCSRCHFYSDWTVRVRTMSGQERTIACPDGPETLVAHVKQTLAQFDPKCHILEQVTLVLPCEASSGSHTDPTDPALEDGRTLDSYGVTKRDMLDLFLVDMDWSDACLEMIESIRNGGAEIHFDTGIDDDEVLAVSWALVNAVCLLSMSSTVIRSRCHLIIEAICFHAILYFRLFFAPMSRRSILQCQHCGFVHT